MAFRKNLVYCGVVIRSERVTCPSREHAALWEIQLNAYERKLDGHSLCHWELKEEA